MALSIRKSEAKGPLTTLQLQRERGCPVRGWPAGGPQAARGGYFPASSAWTSFRETELMQ
ncbi:MAG: hypothetical protein JWO34_1247 [Arthrobacter sp.]|nr:hypothetical protein [Arthrobacter sp.]